MTPLHKNVWLWAFLIGIVTITLIRPLLRRIPEAPPVLGSLPPFELVAADAGRLGLADLEGSVWVLGFFSSGDDGACAGLIESMSVLGARYDEAGIEEVRLLGIGLEPALPPAALDEFGTRRGLAPQRWTLATGALEQVELLADALAGAADRQPGATDRQPGAAGRQPGAAGARVRPHGTPPPCRLFLVDGSGGIRGAYRDDTLGLDEVFHRSKHVADASLP